MALFQTPYRKVDRETGLSPIEIVWLTADEEDGIHRCSSKF